MPEYVEEKTKGAYKASDVTCISLEDIYNMDIDKIKSDFGYEGVEKKKDHKRTVRYE